MRRLRRLGRVHRFESAAGAPGGTGWSLLALAAPEPPRAARLGDLRALLRESPSRAVTTDGAAPTLARQMAAGAAVALAYPQDGRQPEVFVDPVLAVVALRDDEDSVAVARGGIGSASGPTVADVRNVLDEESERGATPTVPHQAVRASAGRERFCGDVERIQGYIAAGDVYVVNLARQLSATWPGDVHELYRGLRAESPAPHGVVIERRSGSGLAVLSPETFLRANGRRILTRPIKGTRSRDADPETDRRLGDELRTSVKERAENTMIVDLERNDLGKVCEIGSVEVTELCVLERHPTVWQLVSTVRGTLRRGVDYVTALRACFPGGSVTGAPKLRAMEVIDELEPVPRGWYCGAVGWVGPTAMELAVTIRTTALDADGTATYGTGSGIVADSDPVSEYEETWTKALPFLRAVNAIDPSAAQV